MLEFNFWYNYLSNDAKPANNNTSTERIPPPSIYSTRDTDGGPSLLKLVEETNTPNWSDVLTRAKSHPHELTTQSSRDDHPDETPLTLSLLKHAPPTLIRQLISINPLSARTVSHGQGTRTPLHLAVFLKSPPEIIETLLEAYPEAALHPKKDGSIPLHAVTDVPTARLLLRYHPTSVGCVNKAQYLPLHICTYDENRCADLCEYLIEEGRKVNVGDVGNGQRGGGSGRGGGSLYYGGSGGAGGGVFCESLNRISPLMAACHVITRGSEASEFAAPHRDYAAVTATYPPLGEIAQRKWKKLEVICRAAAMTLHEDRCQALTTATNATANESTSPPTPKPFVFRMLHAVLELQCPSPIVSYAIRTHPHQIHEVDCWHRTPLSMAASRKTIDSHVLTELSVSTPISNTHLLTPHPHPDSVPSSCAQLLDERGRLPLHLAILGGRYYDEGLRALIAAEPRALEARDGMMHLCPFLMAAAVGDGSSVTLDLVYGLLRESPCAVSQLRTPQPCISGTDGGVECLPQKEHSFFKKLKSSRQKRYHCLRVVVAAILFCTPLVIIWMCCYYLDGMLARGLERTLSFLVS